MCCSWQRNVSELQDDNPLTLYQNSLESLDHILVSQEFYDQSKKRLWLFKGMEIINDHLNDDNHKETGTTDHGIVKATFEYNPNKDWATIFKHIN